MQTGHLLEFNCLACKKPIRFSVFGLTEANKPLQCPHCGKCYQLNDETLQRQLAKFEALCSQIRESEEILGNTAVAVNVGSKQVEVPYRLLLTRLNSKLNLKIGEELISISFRLEPCYDTLQ